jgi:hypothetical protein
MAYKLLRIGVLRLEDSTSIPPDVNNVDWQAYQRWLAAGNTPQPADPDPLPIDLSDLDNLDKVIKAIGLTIAQVTNTPVATVKQIFKTKYQSLP